MPKVSRKPWNGPEHVRQRAQLAVERAALELERGDPDRAKEILLDTLLDEAICEEEVAILLGVSRRTIQDWRITGGGPPFFKLSGKSKGGVRYSRLRVLEYREAVTRLCTFRVLRDRVDP